jgi:hypothetical protein
MSSSNHLPQPEANAKNSGNRIALVIGNSEYQYTRRLKNAEADAAAIVWALADVGFKSHKKGEDGAFIPLFSSQNTRLIKMKRLLSDFSERAHEAEMAIVYFSGHGIEVEFRNFLIPTDAQILSVSRATHEAVPLREVIDATSGASKLRLVILDACRDNPFLDRMEGLDQGKSVGIRTGLGAPRNPGNAWVFYAATEGQIAKEGPDGGLSPFAESLSQRLRERGQDLFHTLGKVAEDVRQATSNSQEPRFYGAPPADEIYLFPQVIARPKPPASNEVSYAALRSFLHFRPKARQIKQRRGFRGFPLWSVTGMSVFLILSGLVVYDRLRGAAVAPADNRAAAGIDNHYLKRGERTNCS